MWITRDRLGLDVGTHTIKVANLRRVGLSTQIVDTLEMERPDDPEDCTRLLRKLVHERGWAQVPCVCGLPSEMASVRILDLPNDQPSTARKMAAAHIEEFEILADAPTVTEYAVTTSGDQHWLLLAVARVDSIMRELQLPRDAGMNIINTLPSSVALQYGARYLHNEPRKPFSCIDIGYEGTEWIVGHRKALLHTQRLAIGSRILGAERDATDATPIAQRPEFLQWVEDIKSTLRSYQLQFDASECAPNRVALCGGFTLDRDQRNMLQDALGMPLEDTQQHLFTKAIGLAYAGLERRANAISLLPPTLKSLEEGRKQFRYWVGAAAALVLTTILIALNAYRDLQWNARQQAQYEFRVEQLQSLEMERAYYEERNVELMTQLTPLRTASRNNRAVTLLLDAISESKAPDDWMFLISDADSYFHAMQRAMAEPSRTPMTEDPRIARDRIQLMILEGYTPVDDLSTVRAMIDKLRSYPFVADLDLLPDDKILAEGSHAEEWMDQHARRFALELQLMREAP